MAARVGSGRLFRCVSRSGTVWGEGITEKVVWHVVKEFAAKLGVPKLAPDDLRRSCARLCHAAGGEMEQIQFLLGHVSVQTTEKYLGSSSDCAELSTTGSVLSPPNDHLDGYRTIRPTGKGSSGNGSLRVAARLSYGPSNQP
jgi:hypothetical protein